jgi:hypothetical protein
LPEAAGKSYEVGGPEVLTYEQLMRQYGELTGKRFRLLSLPVLTPRLSSFWLKLVTAVPTNIARSLIDGLTDDAIANDEEIRKLIPFELKDFKQSVRKALEAEQMIDWFAGGPSFGRRRRHPTDVRVGDVIDAWRVIAVEPERRLTLLMEMRGPGSGVLEFVIGDDGEYRTLNVTGYWHPAGPAGLIYWYILLPAHGFAFRGLTIAIAHRAEKFDGPTSEVPSEG